MYHSFDDLRRRMATKAAQLGGDAVIVGPEATDSELIVLATGMIVSEEKKLVGDVVVFN